MYGSLVTKVIGTLWRSRRFCRSRLKMKANSYAGPKHGARHRADDRRPRVVEEAPIRLPGVLGVIDGADRLRVAFRPRAGTSSNASLGPVVITR